MSHGRQLAGFLVVGGIGFGVDVAVLYALLSLDGGLYGSRLVSFLAAATFTWWGNRRWTFAGELARPKGSASEWGGYVVAMGLGGAVNLAVYGVLVGPLGWFKAHPWLAVAAGTLAGLVFNFLVARRLLRTRP